MGAGEMGRKINHDRASPKNPVNDLDFDTVDGQNPAPARMMIIPLFIGL